MTEKPESDYFRPRQNSNLDNTLQRLFKSNPYFMFCQQIKVGN